MSVHFVVVRIRRHFHIPGCYNVTDIYSELTTEQGWVREIFYLLCNQYQFPDLASGDPTVSYPERTRCPWHRISIKKEFPTDTGCSCAATCCLDNVDYESIGCMQHDEISNTNDIQPIGFMVGMVVVIAVFGWM